MTTVTTKDATMLARNTRTESRWHDFSRRLFRSKGATAGLVVVVVFFLLSALAPWLAPYDPIRIDSLRALRPPGGAYLFGSDQYGRDVLSRVLYGGQVSMTIGLISVAIAALFGVTVGLIAGYYGGWADSVFMRIIDVMLAFPGILLSLAIVSMLGPSLRNLMIAVGIAAIPTYARLTRGSVLSAREHLYVEAARTVGVPDHLIAIRHILPNVIAPIIVAATLGVGTAIIVAAALSFLGLGSQPPQPEWGRMLSEGRPYLRDQWWISTFPGLAIMVVVLALNLFGDGLRDALDPRLKT
jgi:peptide/nickel transport system permease protein